MTSIITDDYKKAMLRLYSSTDNSAAKSESSKSENHFDNVLKSLEHKAPAPSIEEAKFIDKPNTQINLKETDLKEIEEVRKINIHTSAEPPPIITPSPIAVNGVIGDMPLDEENSIGIPPKPPTIINEPKLEVSEEKSIPKTPTIIAAEDFERDEVVKVDPDLIPDQAEGIKNIIIDAGKFHGVDPSLGLAIARVESAFNPKAVSKDGFHSKGVFQLLDSTGKDIHASSGMTEPYRPFDPSMNSYLGLGHFRRLLDLFSKESTLTSSLKTVGAQSADDLEKLAVAAFNAGEGNVARAQQKALQNGKDPSVFENVRSYLPDITRSYVDKVGSLRDQFAQNIVDTKNV